MASRALTRPATVRAFAWTAVALSVLWLGTEAVTTGLGANPVEAATHASGLFALRFLVASLATTPLRRLGLGFLAPVRRIFGLAAFGWAALHFSIYLAFDLGFDFGFLAEDIVERPYLTLGFSAFGLLSVLAVTSTRRWQKRLARDWVRLHRLVYPAAVLASAHFYWLVKADVREPAFYAGAIALLLGARGTRAWKRRETRSGTASSVENASAAPPV